MYIQSEISCPKFAHIEMVSNGFILETLGKMIKDNNTVHADFPSLINELADRFGLLAYGEKIHITTTDPNKKHDGGPTMCYRGVTYL